MFRVIVAGSRGFKDYGLMRQRLDRILIHRLPRVLIVSGGAPGADMLGEMYALERCPKPHYVRYSADWKAHGRRAGPIRNGEMARNADALVAFWDGESAGTADMIRQAKAARLLVRVVRYTEEGSADE